MWRVIPGQLLHHRAWDDEFVLYNDLSGDTHLLGASAMHILLALQCSASDDAAVTESLGQAFDCDQDGQLPSHVAGLLADLMALSLIERAAC